MSRPRKICSDCGRNLDLHRFPANVRVEPFVRATCSDCVRAKAPPCGAVPACPICKRRPIDGHDTFCTPERRAASPYPVPAVAIEPAARVVTLQAEQQCQGPCGQVLPRSLEYFQRVPGDRLGAYCLDCHGERIRSGKARQKGRYGEGVA